MRRVLRHGSSSLGSLAKNSDHAFAVSNAMMVYSSNSLYTMIPKNACTTFRLSIGLHNGAIKSPEDYRWIHKNNDTFRPSLAEMLTSSYSFIILRCPFARLVSLYLDKFVSRDPVAWHFKEVASNDPDLPLLSFRGFCNELRSRSVLTANKHWRPQSDFLLYEEYDSVFCVEELASCNATIKHRAGLDILDSRKYVKHDAGRFKAVGGLQDNYSDEEPWKIETLFRVGLRPHYRSFYDDELIELVAKIYAEDLKLYRSYFPKLGLFPALPDQSVKASASVAQATNQKPTVVNEAARLGTSTTVMRTSKLGE